MNFDLVIQALRRHRASLLGPVCTQVVAASIIAAMIDLQQSISSSLSHAARTHAPTSNVVEATNIFLHDAGYLSVVIVGITMSLAIGRQLRDIALLRSIGASPAQIRHSVVGQAGATAVPAAVAGSLLAIPFCAVWLQLLKAAHVISGNVSFAVDPKSFVTAGITVLITSVVGAYLASVRASRRKPATALVEASTCGRREPVLRIVAGAVLVVAGIVLAVLLSTIAPSQMADAGVFVMLAECVGVGLLSPVLLRTATRIVGRLVPSDLVTIAVDDLRTQARALGGALVPLVLSVAFTAVNVGMHSTATHTGHADTKVSQWMDYSGTATFGAFAAVAALNCFVTVAIARRRELSTLQLIGASRGTVLKVTGIEAAVVAVAALFVAAAVAVIALLPVVHASYGVWMPYFPSTAIVVGIVGVGAVVGAGMLLPAVRLTRRSPVRVLAAAS